MKKNSKSITNPKIDEFDDFFSSEPDANEKAWGLIHDFYHEILTYMEKNDISRSDLSKKLNRSRSAISQMFNKTPNVSLKKMVEIADALDHNLKISFEMLDSVIGNIDDKYPFVAVKDIDKILLTDALDDTLANVIPFPISSAANDDRIPSNAEVALA